MKTDMRIGSTPIEEYTLVYPSRLANAEKEAAHLLQNALWEHRGIRLPITNDSIPHLHGILIGHTMHTPHPPLAHHDYAVTVEETGDVQLLFGSLTALYHAVDVFITRFVAGEEKIAPMAGSDLDILSPLQDASLYEKGDIRVCYHNIFGGVSPDKGVTQTAPPLRHAISARLYREYRADVVCLQEYNMQTRYEFYSKDRILEQGYREVPGEVLPRKESQTPIFYDPATLELLRWGNLSYITPECDNIRKRGYGKMVTWGIFLHKATQKRFAVANTHLDHQDSHDANLRRLSQAKELLALLERDVTAEDPAEIPVILGGDLNSNYIREEEQYGMIGALQELKAAGFADVQMTLPGADPVSSWDGYSVFDPEKQVFVRLGRGKGDMRSSIDHCMYRGNITPIALDVVNNAAARRTSDHNPVIVDFML